MKDEAQVRNIFQHCRISILFIHSLYRPKYLVENHKLLLDSIAAELKPLLCCHVHQLYLTLRPASVLLSWNIKQTKWGRFFNQCRKSMENFKLLCQRLEDIRINQLDRLLESLRHFTLCPESRDKTWTLEEFVDAVKDSCRKATSVSLPFIVFQLYQNNAPFANTFYRKSNKGIGSWRMECLSSSS